MKLPLFSLLVFLFAGNSLSFAELVHRYRFNDGGGSTTVKDWKGSAHGTVVNGGEFTADGQLRLSGGSAAGPYVDLPNGVLSSLTNVTFETWLTWDGGSNWQRIFDFNTNTGLSENAEGGGLSYFWFTPLGGQGTMRFAYSSSGNTGEDLISINTRRMDVGKETHLAISYNFFSQNCTVYYNGRPVASGPALLNPKMIMDTNCWLGRSSTTFDSTFGGQFNEFRMYSTALTASDILTSYVNGPEIIFEDRGAFQDLKLELPATLGRYRNVQAIPRGDFANYKGVNLSTQSDATYSSSDPSVASVSTNGVVYGVAAGKATITTSYGGKQASREIEIVESHPKLRHRYTFNDQPGSSTIADVFGEAEGTLINGGTLDGQTLFLSGGSALGPYVNLPNGIISALTNATFEMWVKQQNETQNWQRIFDFGCNGNYYEDADGGGAVYMFFSPLGGNVSRFSVDLVPQQDTAVLNSTVLPPNQMYHLVIVYDFLKGEATYYIDAEKITSAATVHALNAIRDANNWLGRSNFTGDFTFKGVFDEFRIWQDALSQEEIRAHFAAGPDQEGELTFVDLQALHTMGEGEEQLATMLAHYVLRRNVNVTKGKGTVYESSNPSILTVDENGLIRAVGPGKATISGTYESLKDEIEITVTSSSIRIQSIERLAGNKTRLRIETFDTDLNHLVESSSEVKSTDWSLVSEASVKLEEDGTLTAEFPTAVGTRMFYRVRVE